MTRQLIEVAYEITPRCNLDCIHCYNTDNINSDMYEMNTTESKRAIRILRDFGLQKLKIGGGEPQMREDFFEIYDYSKSLGLETDFSTNGLLIKRNLNKLLEYNVKKIQISLDNIGTNHDVFRNKKGLFGIVDEAIDLLNKNNIKINIATTLTTKNYENVKEMWDYCIEKEVFRWKIMKYIPKNANDPLMLNPRLYNNVVNELLEYKELRNSSPELIVAREFDKIHQNTDYNDMQCFGGKSFLSLKPNGNITPCSYIDDIVCGNILKDDINEIWNSKEMLDFTKECYDTSCLFSTNCKGGCKAVSYFTKRNNSQEIKTNLEITKSQRQDINDCDPYCQMKEIVRN